jgi:Amt family ammonium transporter
VSVTAGVLFFVIKKTLGLRVAADEEIQGLDVLEHGLEGYPDDVHYAH